MQIQHQAAANAENFPVASLLLPSQARKKIMIFYDFVRGCDQISDDVKLSGAQREQALLLLIERMEKAQTELLPRWAEPYAAAIKAGDIEPSYGQNLLRAFMQDCSKTRYEDWKELLDYCRSSANPVGRFVLASCVEEEANLEASDALCTVLQLLNHVQDMHEDYLKRGRIYMPQQWMREAGMTEDMLGETISLEALVQVKQRVLDGCEALLIESCVLGNTIGSWRVRLEIRWIWQIARRLLQRLRKQDVLASHVTLPKHTVLLCLLAALMPFSFHQKVLAHGH